MKKKIKLLLLTIIILNLTIISLLYIYFGIFARPDNLSIYEAMTKITDAIFVPMFLTIYIPATIYLTIYIPATIIISIVIVYIIEIIKKKFSRKQNSLEPK